MRIKTGDCVEVLPGQKTYGTGGIEDGEQGVVIDGDNKVYLKLIFPASQDECWNNDKRDGWWVMRARVKLVYRQA